MCWPQRVDPDPALAGLGVAGMGYALHRPAIGIGSIAKRDEMHVLVGTGVGTRHRHTPAGAEF